MLDLAWAHGVTAQVVAAVDTAGSDPEASALLADRHRMEVFRGLRSAAGLVRVAEVLSGAGVRYAAMKGVALGALTGREPGDRHGVDLDLLVRPEDLDAAQRALLRAGFFVAPGSFPPLGDDSRTRFLMWSSCEQTVVTDGIQVDLHWRPFHGHLAGFTSDELLRRAVSVEVAGAWVDTLDPDAALAHTAMNGAKDYWTRLRSTVDAHLLVEVAGASWESAARLLEVGPALAEARAGVDVLRGRDVGSAPAVRMWVDGVEGRLDWDECGRPPGGWIRHLRRTMRLMPGLRSAGAIVCHYLVPPASSADSRMAPRWWWAEALIRRPAKITKLVLRGKDPESA